MTGPRPDPAVTGPPRRRREGRNAAAMDQWGFRFFAVVLAIHWWSGTWAALIDHGDSVWGWINAVASCYAVVWFIPLAWRFRPRPCATCVAIARARRQP